MGEGDIMKGPHQTQERGDRRQGPASNSSWAVSWILELTPLSGL